MRRITILRKGAGGVSAYLQMKTANQIIKDKGLAVDGDVQRFHTANVLRRIKRYMPFRSGFTYKLTVAQTNTARPEIVTDTPYAKYLFYGKKMVNVKTGKGPRMIPGVGPRYKKGTKLKETKIPLEYFRGKNPAAGARWDLALSAAEGKAMAEDVRRYIARRKQ